MTSSSLIYAEQWLHLAETAVAGTEVLLRQEKHSTSRAGAGLLSAVGGSVQGGAGEGWLIFPEGAVLIRGIAAGGDPIGAIWGTVGYTVLLCFMLFKTGTIARSIFSAH